jgi:hypothetical protein
LKATIRDSQTLELIRPEDVQAYLSARAWNNVRPSGEYAFLYRRIIDDRKYDLLVPSTNEIDDFPQRIADIVRTLESVEDRSQLEIISDLARVRSDVVRIRRADAADGTLLLEDGAMLIKSAYETVLAAACSAATPRVYYRGKKPAKATQYMEKARLGQSERGSYVVTVISPVPPSQPNLGIGAPPPFERQVTTLVSDGLHATVEASEYALSKSDTAHFREATKDGVSANLLDGVIGLMGIRHNTVDVNFAWSPEIPMPEDLYKVITIEPDYFGVIEAASRELKEQEPNPSVQVVGVVEGLRRPQGDDAGHITLSTFLEGKARKVHIDLDAEIYDHAILAHRTKRVVTCVGTLARYGRTTVLYDLTHFEVAPPFDVEEGEVGPLFAEPKE